MSPPQLMEMVPSSFGAFFFVDRQEMNLTKHEAPWVQVLGLPYDFVFARPEFTHLTDGR